jgi:rare lipoprotein A
MMAAMRRMLLRRGFPLWLLIGIGCLPACAASLQRSSAIGDVETGDATFYGRRQHGGPTASGERFNMYAFTAAHRRLPMGSIVRVENLRNGLSVVVRINDRGPFTRGRIIDLSYAAAESIGMLQAGVVPVRLRLLQIPVP